MGLKPKTVLSIDIDNDATVVTELTQRRHKIELTSQHILRSTAELSSLPINKNQITVTSLPAPSLFFKHVPSSPALARAKDLRKEMLPFLQKQNLPLRLEDCFWQVVLSGSAITLVAARKELVEETRSRLSGAGFSIAGIVPLAYGLYNLIAHNYGEKGKFILLNMRGRVSDIVIHEEKRLWTYAIPMGKSAVIDSAGSPEMFLQEIKRVVGTHFLQNPTKSPKASSRLYLCGANYPAAILSSLREQFAGSEIVQVNPLRKISCPKALIPSDPYSIAASIGYALTGLRVASAQYVNLIGEQVRTERIASRINDAEKIAVYSMVAACLGFLFLNARLFVKMNAASSRARQTLSHVQTYIPEIKKLNEENARFETTMRFLQGKIDNQALFLNAMAAVASGTSAGMELKEFELKEGEKGLELFISGSSVDYNEINTFLAKLRGNKSIKDVKVISSGVTDQKDKTIEFKVRFDMSNGDGASI